MGNSMQLDNRYGDFYDCKISKNSTNCLLKLFSLIIHGNGHSFGSEFDKKCAKIITKQ